MPEIKKKQYETPTVIFRSFHSSSAKCMTKDYKDTRNAIKAQVAMCNYVNKHKIYDVQIIRRKSVLRLIKNEAYQQTQEYRDWIMNRFLKKN